MARIKVHELRHKTKPDILAQLKDLKAIVAKLETSVSVFSDKLELKVYGFNDKLPALLSKVLATAKSFMPTDDRFKVVKEDMK
ncbi:nardilysin-like [Pyrus ussuriensis x Pyrus communis]|uniref:Nardilysin-like n=1 Tax=Pyrus ussuriensis x Pyrus communis TaxID=2448454 RepID=A0A5N5I6V2_9ROSA|nr:nardilysin-like [Pyrus ussuriensis x Pyrus communis]